MSDTNDKHWQITGVSDHRLTRQPDLFDASVVTILREVHSDSPVVDLRTNVQYQAEQQYHAKHHPSVSQTERDAARAQASSVTTRDVGTQQHLRLIQAERDAGLEK